MKPFRRAFIVGSLTFHLVAGLGLLDFKQAEPERKPIAIYTIDNGGSVIIRRCYFVQDCQAAGREMIKCGGSIWFPPFDPEKRKP